MIEKSNLLELAFSMPKTELHLHIEGTFEAEQMFEFAQRNKISLSYTSIEQLKQAYSFSNLQEFLDLYYQGMSVLITEQDFYELTLAYLTKVHSQNVVHVEIFFDPQGHLERGISFSTQINGIYRALKEAETNWGMSFKLIMSFLRHLSEESAFSTLEQAIPHLEKIYAVGLDSSELGHPPEKFLRVFKACKNLGLKVTAHAGEEGPPKYIWQAVNDLKVDRIDHGNRCLEDDELVQHINHEQLTLTVCPLSNQKLCVVNDMSQHPIKEMLHQGLAATVNSDDPAYFGGYMNDNYQALIEQTQLTKDELKQLAKNSFNGAWISPDRRQHFLNQIDTLFA
ncbi:adenine deaminase [Marinomonas sp. S3726]|uniref:adenosine deaminase n=1 Tax=Marinomonas sp. S3726 TaxID=579484 RepID=UPI00061F4206|nr:adenosine deaminase [Marinomonas sp. S3726]KJZ14467.1 adenine deaminase [Marinomonas sp. S3726]